VSAEPSTAGTAPPIPIFVGGLHRSGTTLLADLIGAHPDVSPLTDTGAFHDEGQFLQTVMPTAGQCGGPGRFAFGARAHLIETDVVDRDDERARLLASWSPYWDLGRGHVVEKSPPNLLRFRYLRALFPEAWCIAVVRHPIAVSFATQGWAKQPIGPLLEHWLVAHEQFEADRPHVDRLLFVRYEDLVHDVPGTLATIDAAIGLPQHVPDIEVRKDTNARYLRRWRSARGVPLHPRIVEKVRYTRRLDRLGYGYRLDGQTRDQLAAT
jgi:hypothetical protein